MLTSLPVKITFDDLLSGDVALDFSSAKARLLISCSLVPGATTILPRSFPIHLHRNLDLVFFSKFGVVFRPGGF